MKNLKVVVVGAIGKISLLWSNTTNKVPGDYIPTLFGN